MFIGEMDGLFFILIIIALATLAQARITRSYKKYSKVQLSRDIRGADLAKKFLESEGLYDVHIELAQGGALTDHYDPRTKIVRLSKDVYYGNSIASVAVAAHEAGHAVQDAKKYPLFQLRSALVPVTQFASSTSWILIFVGIISEKLLFLTWLGIGLFAVTTIFQLVTLPVELDASNRALAFLNESGTIEYSEVTGAKKVLKAAAFTYLVSLLVSIMYLLRYIAIFGRRD